MTIIRDSAPVRIGDLIKIGDSSQKPKPNLTVSPENTTNIRLRKPPYVKPKKYPNQIVAENLDFFDLKSWKELLVQRQKGEDWGKIREKVPEALLNKLGLVMTESRENGFVNPHVREGEVVWHQMTGDEFGRNHSCKCDLCETDFSSGKCKGKPFRNIKGMKEFKPCWGVK